MIRICLGYFMVWKVVKSKLETKHLVFNFHLSVTPPCFNCFRNALIVPTTYDTNNCSIIQMLNLISKTCKKITHLLNFQNECESHLKVSGKEIPLSPELVH